MIQQVNLLVKDLKPSREWLDLQQTVWGVGFVIGLLVLVAGNKGLELAELEGVIGTLQRELGQIGQGTATSSDAQVLAAKIAQLEADMAAVRLQAGTLQGAQRLSGFSSEIRILSESSVGGLWLTEFSVHRSSSGEPTINLSGRTHAPQTVGRYVEELKAHGGLAGYTFADIEVMRGESDLTFSLNGQLRERNAELR